MPARAGAAPHQSSFACDVTALDPGDPEAPLQVLGPQGCAHASKPCVSRRKATEFRVPGRSGDGQHGRRVGRQQSGAAADAASVSSEDRMGAWKKARCGSSSLAGRARRSSSRPTTAPQVARAYEAESGCGGPDHHPDGPRGRACAYRDPLLREDRHSPARRAGERAAARQEHAPATGCSSSARGRAGFTLCGRSGSLFAGFSDEIRADKRWRRQVAEHKLAELDAAATRIASMRELLERLCTRCHCRTLEACGRAIYEKGLHPVERMPAVLRRGRKLESSD